MMKKGKPMLEFQSSEWMQDLAFMVDITQHLNNLNSCKAAKDLSHSISTTYHTCIQVKDVLVGDTTFRWWHCSFPLFEKCACHGAKKWRESIHRQDNKVVAEVQATISDFWRTWDGFPSLLLTIHSKPLWSARCLASWNNWLAVWLRFEDQVCLGELGHIFFSIFFRVAPKRHPLLQKFCACLRRHIFVKKCSLWWTSTKQSCAQGSHMLT